MTTPSGEPYKGFRISLGGALDPATVVRNYDEIERIMGKNKIKFKTHEERTPTGTFRSYSVATG